MADQNSINPPEWGDPKWQAMHGDQFADNLIVKMRHEGPALTCDEMDVIEQFWKEDMRCRRCALVMATKPFEWIEEQVRSDRKFAVAVANTLDAIDVEKYETIVSLINDSRRRMMVALSVREDMSEVIAEARAAA